MKKFWKTGFFIRYTEGNVFVVVALASMAVIGSVGVAVDLGRSQMVQAKLQNAVDAAGLAAGASLNAEDLEGIATKYVQVNFAQGNLGATLNPIAVNLSDDKKKLTISASADLPTTITKIFQTSHVSVNAETEVTRSNRGLEVALVLDTTGSMGNNGKLDALKTAAHDLVDILFGEDATAENLWIGIVPFSQTVNIGSARTNWLNAAHYNGLLWSPTSWSGCVEARYTNGRDITDDPPFDLLHPEAAIPDAPYERLKAYYVPITSYWTLNNSASPTALCSNQASCTCSNYGCGTFASSGNTGYTISCSGSGSSRTCHRTNKTYHLSATSGPNAYCPSAITPLTNVKATLASGIDALVARGGTYINYGAVWGWRLVSPRWRGYWGGTMDTNNLPLNYHAPLMSKAVILMTDGTNSPNTGGSGYSAYASSNTADTSAELDAKTTQVCNAMKAQGIIVYTILLQETNTGVKTLLRNCATTPDMFFDSPTNEALQTAFHAIGDSLANLRISK